MCISSSCLKKSCATEAAVASGRSGSSAGGGSDDLAPMLTFGEDEKCEEVRRIPGDRDGVAPPALCNELSDVRLRKVGVVDRSLFPIELELGALRRGVLAGWFEPGEGEGFSLWLEATGRWAMGDEGGRGVSIAVENDSRFMLSMLSESIAASLFVG